MYQPRNHLANEHKWWLWHFNGDIIYAKLIEEWLYHCSLQKCMIGDKKMTNFSSAHTANNFEFVILFQYFFLPDKYS